MSKSEIFQKLNKENTDKPPLKRTRNPREQAMMAWETLDEPSEEQEKIETIDNLKIQFGTDEIHEEEYKIQHEEDQSPPLKNDDILYSES